MRFFISIIFIVVAFGNFICIGEDRKNISKVPKEAMELKRKGNLQSREEAIATFTEAIKVYENYDTAYFNRGLARFFLGDYQGALEDHSTVIEIDPNFVDAYYARAIDKGELNDKYGAIADYRKAIELDSEYLAAYVNLANKYNEVGNQDSAMVIYKKGLDVCRRKPDPMFYVNYGNALLREKRVNESIDIYTEGINSFPNDKDLSFSRGIAYFMQEDRVNALLDFLKSYELGHERAQKMLDLLHSL